MVEIGPGLGVLTLELAKRAKCLISIEKDPVLVTALKEELKEFPNTKIIEADVRDLNLEGLDLKSGYKVVANLPYYISSPVIRLFLESRKQPKTMVLLLQKEVAERICANPPKMSLLAVSVQFYAKPEIVSLVPKESFWPEPEVNSAIIKLTVLEKKRKIESGLFFRIVRAGFSHPRKQLLNNLSENLKMDREKVVGWLSKNSIRPEQRAETLSLADWENLASSY